MLEHKTLSYHILDNLIYPLGLSSPYLHFLLGLVTIFLYLIMISFPNKRTMS